MLKVCSSTQVQIQMNLRCESIYSDLSIWIFARSDVTKSLSLNKHMKTNITINFPFGVRIRMLEQSQKMYFEIMGPGEKLHYCGLTILCCKLTCQ